MQHGPHSRSCSKKAGALARQGLPPNAPTVPEYAATVLWVMKQRPWALSQLRPWPVSSRRVCSALMAMSSGAIRQFTETAYNDCRPALSFDCVPTPVMFTHTSRASQYWAIALNVCIQQPLNRMLSCPAGWQMARCTWRIQKCSGPMQRISRSAPWRGRQQRPCCSWRRRSQRRTCRQPSPTRPGTSCAQRSCRQSSNSVPPPQQASSGMEAHATLTAACWCSCRASTAVVAWGLPEFSSQQFLPCGLCLHVEFECELEQHGCP